MTEPATPATPATRLGQASTWQAAEWATIHSAARWLVGAAAAVAAAFVAGVQLSTLSRLIPDDSGRLVLALAAGLVGFIAVGGVLFLAARVLVHPGWTLNKLAHLDGPHPTRWRDHWLRTELETQRGLLAPAEDLYPAQLYRHHRRLLVATYELHEKGQTTLPADLSRDEPGEPHRTYRTDVDADVTNLETRLHNIDAITTRVVNAANLAHVRRRYRTLVRSLPIAGALLVGAVATFVVATTTGSDPPITTPTGIQITFSPDPAPLTAAGLPLTCANRTIRAIAVGGTLQHPIVVTRDPRCRLNQTRLSADVGMVLPDLPTP